MNSVIKEANTSPSSVIWSKSAWFTLKGKDSHMGTLLRGLQRRRSSACDHLCCYRHGAGVSSGGVSSIQQSEIVFDKFHVMKLIDQGSMMCVKLTGSRRCEANKHFKKPLWLYRKNPEYLSELNRLVLTALTTTICGRRRLQCVWHSEKSTLPSQTSWAERRL